MMTLGFDCVCESVHVRCFEFEFTLRFEIRDRAIQQHHVLLGSHSMKLVMRVGCAKLGHCLSWNWSRRIEWSEVATNRMNEWADAIQDWSLSNFEFDDECVNLWEIRRRSYDWWDPEMRLLTILTTMTVRCELCFRSNQLVDIRSIGSDWLWPLPRVQYFTLVGWKVILKYYLHERFKYGNLSIQNTKGLKPLFWAPICSHSLGIEYVSIDT